MSLNPACRVVMYSHDAMGMGHVRRNLLVAEALAEACGPLQATLLIAGVADAAVFEPPPGVDYLTLPALRKAAGGGYASRRLPLGAAGILAIRSAAILGAVAEFDPDVLIVDKLPRGVGHELDATLAHLRRRGRARCVLALRDILDEPDAVRDEWRREGSEDVIRARYDAVWVYGCPAVYDTVREYALSPDVAAKVRYTGYLDRRAAAAQHSSPAAAAAEAAVDEGGGRGWPGAEEPAAAPPPQSASRAGADERFVLCTVGGGEDGAELAEAFADAPLPAGTSGVLLTGPFMPAAARERLARKAAARRPGQAPLRVFRFSRRPHELIRRAERVISMGGYNTVWEILSHGKPCLVAPRVAPRREQWIRAERLSAMGLLEMIHPRDVTPASLGAWLARDLLPPVPVRQVVDMEGLRRLPALLDELLQPAPIVQPSPCGTDAAVAAPDLPAEEVSGERV